MNKKRRENVTRVPLHLDVLVEMQDGEYVAHCLQLDIMAAGTTEDAAVSDLLDLVKAQIDFAVQHDNLANLFKPAPPEVWQKLPGLYTGEPKCQRRPALTSDNKLAYESTVCYA